jgi:hypothetical protein
MIGRDARGPDRGGFGNSPPLFQPRRTTGQPLASLPAQLGRAPLQGPGAGHSYPFDLHRDTLHRVSTIILNEHIPRSPDGNEFVHCHVGISHGAECDRWIDHSQVAAILPISLGEREPAWEFAFSSIERPSVGWITGTSKNCKALPRPQCEHPSPSDNRPQTIDLKGINPALGN